MLCLPMATSSLRSENATRQILVEGRSPENGFKQLFFAVRALNAPSRLSYKAVTSIGEDVVVLLF